MALACAALAVCGGNIATALLCLYGFAFGVMITSITRLVLVHRQTRGMREVNRLNLLWGVGAFLCPAIASSVVRATNIRVLLVIVTTVLASLAVGTFVCPEPQAPFATSPLPVGRSAVRFPKLSVAVGFYTFIAVGTEATFGAWASTYSHLLGESAVQAVATISFFWFGLLSSRALAGSSAVVRLREMALLSLSFSVASAGAVIFLSATQAATLLPGAFLVGFGLGPIFPTLQAITLPHVASNRIFVIGGAASSLLPWLTGVASTSLGSLRTAMYIPVLLILLLLPCTWLLKPVVSAMTTGPRG